MRSGESHLVSNREEAVPASFFARWYELCIERTSIALERPVHRPWQLVSHILGMRKWRLTKDDSQSVHFTWGSQPTEFDIRAFEQEAQAAVSGNEAGDHHKKDEDLEIGPAQLLLNAWPDERSNDPRTRREDAYEDEGGCWHGEGRLCEQECRGCDSCKACMVGVSGGQRDDYRMPTIRKEEPRSEVLERVPEFVNLRQPKHIPQSDPCTNDLLPEVPFALRPRGAPLFVRSRRLFR